MIWYYQIVIYCVCRDMFPGFLLIYSHLKGIKVDNEC